MRKLKRFLILNLALLIVFAMFPMTAFAEGEKTSYPVFLKHDEVVLGRYDPDYTWDESEYRYSYSGTLQGREVFYAEITGYAGGSEYEDVHDVKITVTDGNGKVIEKAYAGDGKEGSLTFGREELSTDNFYLTIDNVAEDEENVYYEVYYTFYKYRSFCEYATVTPSLSLKANKSSKIKLKSYGPEGTTYKLEKWTSSNNKVATVKNGKVTAVGKGVCTVTAHFVGGATADCEVTVTTDPTPKLNYSQKYIYKGGKKLKLKVLYTSKKPKWSTSNKKVATVSKNGYVKAIDHGKCIITAKVGKKTYRCKINVTYRWPDFGAYIYSYNTRGNYFVVKFYNVGERTVTIKAGTKVLHDDYKIFDRKVKLKKTVTLKPKQGKTVRFYVNGTTTDPNMDYFTLYYKFTYDGKVWDGRTWKTNSQFKRGGYWEDTYWDEDWYGDWYWKTS